MATSIKTIINQLKTDEIKFVDLRFTDTRGREQHVTVPSHTISEDFFSQGKAFDGSSIKGWKTIDMSDMIMMPDATTAVMDPFYEEPTLVIRCDIVDPADFKGYERDPRTIAKRAEEYLRSTGIADQAYFGPEPEFFIFDKVRWQTNMHSSSYYIDSEEGAWNSNTDYEHGNHGHRPAVKGGYFPVPPTDSSQNLRSAMAVVLEKMGLIVETHHHEVATGNQNEISTKFDSLVKKADDIQVLKYVVHNIAYMYGKTATFMPKPLAGDNGSGMHCHQSLAKNGENLFNGNEYAGLSKTALYYMGGILKHARTLNAFTNPTTNSYRRLVPGFEAPVMLAYSALNRSAAIRIPYVANPKARRIEVRFPDALANPYLAFTAMLMAGLDGIKNQILPGNPMDKDLYELPKEEMASIPTVCHSLEQAIRHLENDHEFLLAGKVFTEDMLKAYIKLLQEDVTRINLAIHPLEFDMYYSG